MKPDSTSIRLKRQNFRAPLFVHHMIWLRFGESLAEDSPTDIAVLVIPDLLSRTVLVLSKEKIYYPFLEN